MWATKPSDISRLADLQHRLLDTAVQRLKPNGIIVYCVCSLEREEGETQALAFIRRHKNFTIISPSKDALSDLKIDVSCLKSKGWLRLLPHERQGGQDGFFIVYFQRSQSLTHTPKLLKQDDVL
jgi:16S rRNA (cytosine967-C5)-methyltransferase